HLLDTWSCRRRTEPPLGRVSACPYGVWQVEDNATAAFLGRPILAMQALSTQFPLSPLGAIEVALSSIHRGSRGYCDVPGTRRGRRRDVEHRRAYMRPQSGAACCSAVSLYIAGTPLLRLAHQRGHVPAERG